jgi:SET family sugar efflux transporter-like MFS transporter
LASESPSKTTEVDRTALQQIARALAYLWRTPELRVLLTCNCVLGMAVSFVQPFMSLFGTREVKMSLGTFGVFMTANALVNIAIGTWLSNRSDTRFARRSVMLWSSAAGALGYAGYAFVREPWLLFVIGGFVLGVASVTFSQFFAHARELIGRSDVPPAEVPLYMNAVRMAFALAWTIGPAVAAFTLKALSFVGLFSGAALLYLLLFVLVLRFVEAVPPSVKPGTPKEGARLAGLFAEPGIFLWFLALTLMLAAHAMSMSNLSLLVLHVLGGSESQVGIIFSLAPVFELPLMLYVGMLATRVRSESLIRGALVLASIYYLGLASVRAPYQIYPLQAVSAAFVSVTSGVAITFFQSKMPRRLGAATNLYANASRIGGTSSYLTFGLVASRFGHRGTAVACALLALAALVLTVLAGMREPLPDA